MPGPRRYDVPREEYRARSTDGWPEPLMKEPDIVHKMVAPLVDYMMSNPGRDPRFDKEVRELQSLISRATTQSVRYTGKNLSFKGLFPNGGYWETPWMDAPCTESWFSRRVGCSPQAGAWNGH